MASRFSGALQITNLDDFITPSQVFYHFIILVSIISNNFYEIFFVGMYKTYRNSSIKE